MDVTRADYYASRPDYFLLQELRDKIFKDTSEQIINFIIVNKISVNSYMKGLKINEWVPLLYLACSNSKYVDLVKYLIKSNVNIHAMPDSDDIEHILYTCDGLYLKFLYDKGCRPDNGNTVKNIKRRLRKADIKRLVSLIKLNVITCEDIYSTEDPVLYCLKSMTDYFKYAFNVRKDLVNFTAELNEVIEKFLRCVNQLILWKCEITDEACIYAGKYYMFEFLKFDAFKTQINFENVVKYHEHMDKLEVAMLRPLLNDARYEKTCKALNIIPAKDLYLKMSEIMH
jgi:hypothetical protein